MEAYRRDRNVLKDLGGCDTVCKKCESLSQVRLCDPWTAAHQAPLSMEFYRQGYWSGWPFPSPGDLSDPGVEPRSPAL